MLKNILLRADLDVPIINGRIINDYRLQCLIPTLTKYLNQSKKLLIIGHLGRPVQKNTENSLISVKKALEKLINQSISFITEPEKIGEWQKNNSRLAMLENLRFFPGENAQDRQFAKIISHGFDLYIYEAFAHYRPSASIKIIPKILPTKTGDRFNLEVNTLKKIIQNPKKPTLLIISGVKQDKLTLINRLADRFDRVLIGGKIAPLASSLAGIHPNLTPAVLIPDGLDINKNSLNLFVKAITKAHTIVFNGPLGRFEDGRHIKSTKTLLNALKNSSAFTLLGGGDTLEAITKFKFKYTDFSFVSTGGGAMLKFLATSTHPILSATIN